MRHHDNQKYKLWSQSIWRRPKGQDLGASMDTQLVQLPEQSSGAQPSSALVSSTHQGCAVTRKKYFATVLELSFSEFVLYLSIYFCSNFHSFSEMKGILLLHTFPLKIFVFRYKINPEVVWTMCFTTLSRALLTVLHCIFNNTIVRSF